MPKPFQYVVHISPCEFQRILSSNIVAKMKAKKRKSEKTQFHITCKAPFKIHQLLKDLTNLHVQVLDQI